MIFMEKDTCKVDSARYFMDFTQDESCGKCVPCRVSTKRILEILECICGGLGRDSDIDTLEMLSVQIKQTSVRDLDRVRPPRLRVQSSYSAASLKLKSMRNAAWQRVAVL